MARAPFDPKLRARINQSKLKAGSAIPAFLNKRGPLRSLPVLNQLNLSQQHLHDSQLIAEARAAATTKIHSRIIKDLLEFLGQQRIDPHTLSEANICQFFHHLEICRKTFSYLQQVPGGLKTFILCIGLPATIYTPKVHRLWQGLSRRAAVEKRPTAKATPIPVHVIQKVIEKIHNAYSSYWDVPIPMFRACLAVILQYHTLCRLSDMEDLRACHFQKDEYKGSTYIKVTFPKAKNDQNWSGRASIIASESGLTCPVYIIERFFDRCGYLFFDGQNLDSNYIFCRSSTVNIGHSHQTVSDGMRKLSINTLLSDVKRLCLSVGYSGPIGRKSVKMSGVAAGFAAGLSDEALRDKGRWASIDTSAIYRTHTLDYQHALAAATNLSNATSSAAASRVPRLHVFRDCVTARPFHPRRDASDSTAFNNVVQDFRRQDRFRQPAAPIRVPNRPHVFHNIAVSPLFSSNNKSRSYANKGADATNVIHVTKAFESINCYSESEED